MDKHKEDGFYFYYCIFRDEWVIIEIRNGYAYQFGIDDMSKPEELPGVWGDRILMPMNKPEV